MLARRPHSVAELRRALEKKFPSQDISPVVARLRELGYLDDRKYAEHYALSLARNRAYGRQRVRRELKSRLVDYNVIDAAIEKAFESVSERQLLEQTIERKIRTLPKPLPHAKLASLCQSLRRRGFCADDIMKAMRRRPELKAVAEHVDLSSGNEE